MTSRKPSPTLAADPKLVGPAAHDPGHPGHRVDAGSRTGAGLRGHDRPRPRVRRAGAAQTSAGAARTRRALSGSGHGAGSRRQTADRRRRSRATGSRRSPSSPRSSPMVCKLSGLVTEAGSANAAVLEASVEHLLDTFGPSRMMWGSDWPVCELVCSYGEWRSVTRHVASEAQGHRTRTDLLRNSTSNLWNLSDWPARPRWSPRRDRESAAPARKASRAQARGSSPPISTATR